MTFLVLVDVPGPGWPLNFNFPIQNQNDINNKAQEYTFTYLLVSFVVDKADRIWSFLLVEDKFERGITDILVNK